MFNSMFDEVKEVKQFQDFKESCENTVKNCQEIKPLKSLNVKAEAYLELKRTAMVEIICE